MEINEVTAGIISAITMLPVAMLIAVLFKSIVKPIKAAQIISLLVSTAYLVIGPSPLQIAAKYQLVEVTAYSHAYLAFMLIHWVIGFALVFYGIHIVYKKALTNSSSGTDNP